MPESWRKPWATFRKIPDHSWQIPGWGGVSWYQLSLWKKICLFVRKCNVQTALGFFFAGWHFPFSCSVSNLHSSTKRGVEPRLQLGHTCHARRAPVTRPSLVRFPDPLGSDKLVGEPDQVTRATFDVPLLPVRPTLCSLFLPSLLLVGDLNEKIQSIKCLHFICLCPNLSVGGVINSEYPI